MMLITKLYHLDSMPDTSMNIDRLLINYRYICIYETESELPENLQADVFEDGDYNRRVSLLFC